MHHILVKSNRQENNEVKIHDARVYRVLAYAITNLLNQAHGKLKFNMLG